MENPEAIAKKIDAMIIKSRLNALAGMLLVDRSERLSRILKALQKLELGTYLIGTGPSTTGIIPLTQDETIIGRAATPGESQTDLGVDFRVADAIYLAPHEVSRIHAKIIRRQKNDEVEYALYDLKSTCGTFVNNKVVAGSRNGRVLQNWDSISLGPTHVSTYVFLIISK